jgi:hypothetical protein
MFRQEFDVKVALGRRAFNPKLPLLAGWNTVVRSDNLPRAVHVHPDIGERVGVFVGFALGRPFS